eukprot:GILJ01013032.1.p1 GENE.GILJ01013032.1~~GILJ01013032.1.p1  ORF type:complete len:210 (-),score=19.22 GILJ01013032.1:54-683(-)
MVSAPTDDKASSHLHAAIQGSGSTIRIEESHTHTILEIPSFVKNVRQSRANAMSRPLLSVWSFVSRCFRRNSSSENSEEREDKVRYQFPASPPARLLDSRYFFILLISLVVAVAAAIVGQVLVKLLYLVSNIAFYGSFSAMFRDPSLHNLGVGVIFLPCVGGFLTVRQSALVLTSTHSYVMRPPFPACYPLDDMLCPSVATCLCAACIM